MNGLSIEERVYLTIAEIEYSDEYEDNYTLFDKGIEILKNHNSSKEFDDEEREILEEIFTIISS